MLVKQAANVLDILEFFATRKKPASLADISQHFGWSRSNTFNLLTTLTARGFLYTPEVRGRFYPTGRWHSLAHEIAAAEPLPEALLAVVGDLAEETGETVCIAGPSGQYAVFLEAIEAKAAIRYAAAVGGRVPIHATASGQALLCQMTEAQYGEILRKASFERFGPGTPTSAAEVEENIRASLARGWFRSASNYSRDLGGVTLPTPVNGRILAVTVAGPLSRFADVMPEVAGKMHRTIARHFGGDYLARAVPQLATTPAGYDGERAL